MLYTGGAPYRRRKQYHFFCRVPRISRTSDIFTRNFSRYRQLRWIFKINKINKINQETGFMIVSTLKLLYTGSSTKGLIPLLSSWST